MLSVIAQQLLALREARQEGSKEVMFEGRTIPLKEHHVVVTMNPGYLGRTELPDNLKVGHWRRVCVSGWWCVRDRFRQHCNFAVLYTWSRSFSDPSR